jgi:NhaP-type Na+/H+ or K+/H+ antiporter
VTPYGTVVLVLGGLLVVGALGSGLARRSFVSLAALFVLAGFLLGHGALDVLKLDPRSGFVNDVALTALIVVLFRDGLEVDFERLQRAWRPPLRKLVIGMPVTAAIVAVAAHTFTDLDWTQAFLLGALLSPTDPVLSNAVVTNPLVPGAVRHSLNLESGLNDGLALPPVVALIAVLDPTMRHFDVASFIAQDVGLGLVFGIAFGLLGSLLMGRGGSLEREAFPPHEKSLYALGVAFAAYGAASLPPHANGLIAVYVCAIVLGIRRPDLRWAVQRRAEDIVEVVKLGVFVVFGSLLTLHGLFGDGWAALAIVVVTLLVARPAAVAVSLLGTAFDLRARAFMAWFGPKGIATMTFALLVLSRNIRGGERIFNLAALTVFLSIIAHGVTERPGIRWLVRGSP